VQGSTAIVDGVGMSCQAPVLLQDPDEALGAAVAMDGKAANPPIAAEEAACGSAIVGHEPAVLMVAIGEVLN
jgi:hypothetical protein